MRELVILSGKGGTGKTSLAASLAVLSGTAAQRRGLAVVEEPNAPAAGDIRQLWREIKRIQED